MEKNLSKSTLVVIVSFNPDISLLTKNVTAICLQFKNVLIVDNGSANFSEIAKLAEQIDKNITLRELKENMGIAFAQNVGLREATERKLPWLLTMDQDSVIPENLTDEYQNIIEAYDQIGLVAWKQDDRAKGTEIVLNDWFIVSSGCLTNVQALTKAGGFDDKLFIDHVDTDVNIKIRNLGYKTITTAKVKLFHQLGEKTNKRTIRGAAYHAHSPVRVYYIVRNGVVLFRRYFFKQPLWTLQAIKNGVREGAYLLMYQPNKVKNFFLLLRAWFDGIFNRLGKFK